jgi:DNA replication and repair protein RecF
MWLRALNVDRLRNLRSVSVEFTPGLTLITGRNGQGKTSLLEAVYLAGTAHSFRTRRLEELVGWQGGPLSISGEVSGLSGERRVGVVVDGGERHLLVDGVERSLDEFLGRLDLVALPGEAMRTLRDGPEGRRRFLDRGVLGIDPTFLKDIARYRRSLAERNALLRKGAARATAVSRSELDTWDDRLADAAARVHRRRREYVLELSSRLAAAERALFEGDELRVGYRPSPGSLGEKDPSEFAAGYAAHLMRTRARDASLGFTGDGPHRDDLEVTLAGSDLRRFGSAGQVRSAMIALSAGKLGLLKDRRHESPLFLMDDFDSDLDEIRTRSLVDFLRDGGFQALLATSKDGFVNRLGFSFPVIRMEGGLARAA